MAGLCEGGNEPSGSLKAICKENDAENDQKEEKELAGTLAEKKLSSEGSTGRNDEQEKVQGRRRNQMIDDIKICGSYEETKRTAENSWENAGFAVKDLPLGRTIYFVNPHRGEENELGTALACRPLGWAHCTARNGKMEVYFDIFSSLLALIVDFRGIREKLMIRSTVSSLTGGRENDQQGSKRTRVTRRDSKEECNEHSERERQLVLLISTGHP
ncbi:hypothetical protein ANN_18181 [Periplaneta americana]|uniref:Uncharacterized protein n=1 Tax=Periplaneta americana TaxID=6978 RepID=A0ABQ8SN26_PERAM|nr:hypothetical protein ANN_18181 [Periplaneta americana]